MRGGIAAEMAFVKIGLMLTLARVTRGLQGKTAKQVRKYL